MDITVIGGTGHIGTFLVPRLVNAGHQVTVLSRGEGQPYRDDPAWNVVQRVTVDRAAEDESGRFAGRVADLGADAVIDLVCFTLQSATQLVEGLRGHTGHLIHCGSIWMHGKSLRVPITEDARTEPFGEYGTQKAAIAAMLRAETTSGGLPTTSVHPGHISGPGWAPIGPLGNLDPQVWQKLAAGRELQVPGLGAELLSHVHADDVAQVFQLAAEHPKAARGRGLPRHRGLGAHGQGFRGTRSGVVRTGGPSDIGQLGDLQREHLRRVRAAELGPPGAQPPRVDRQGPEFAGLSTEVRAGGCRPRGSRISVAFRRARSRPRIDGRLNE